MRKLLYLFAILCAPVFGQHPYWRLLVYQNNGNSSFMRMYELEFWDSTGNYLSSGGTATASDGFSPANLFDRSMSTSFTTSSVPSFSSPFWVQYHFASSVDVGVVRIAAGLVADSTMNPEIFKVQFSDDGSTWGDATGNITPGQWLGDNGSQTIGAWSVLVGSAGSGQYVNWRVRVNSTLSGDVRINEIGLRTAFGGSSIASATVPAYAIGSNLTLGDQPYKAYDGNPATEFTEQSGGVGLAWTGFAFEQPQKIVQIAFSNDTGTGWSGNSPVSVSVDGSNDAGSNWVTAFNCTFAFTGPSQTQTCGGTPTRQGNVVYSQVREADRASPAHKFAMWGGGIPTVGNPTVTQSNGDIVPASLLGYSGHAVTFVTTPSSSGSACIPGMVSADSSGNAYICYSLNHWVKLSGTTSF